MFPDNFIAFIGITTLVSLAPGANTMFVMSQSALRGHRAGIMAGLGIEVSNVFYFLLIAFGLATVVATSEVIFDALKWMGAFYLAVIGVLAFGRSFQTTGPAPVTEVPTVRSSHGAFFHGLMIALGNPKTITWFLPLLPPVPSASSCATFNSSSRFAAFSEISFFNALIRDRRLSWYGVNLLMS